MGGKYRTNKVKHEHTIIEDVLPLLEEVALLSRVKSIIPGRINRRKGSGVRPYLQMKYNTPTGIKAIAKNSSSLQEVFIVTDYQEEVSIQLASYDFVRG
ncbi:MAG: DUF2103 domain-containing protein [Halanaerobium sp.]|nr:DUF2103 domain-containing protein [Halanaerobium sp.]